MIEARQHLALEPEAFDERRAARRRQDLDGGAPIELAIVALDFVDHAHAAAADFRDEAIRAEPAAGEPARDGARDRRRQIRRLLHEPRIVLVGPQHRQHFDTRRLIVAAFAQPGFAIGRRVFASLVEKRGDARPLGDVHEDGLRVEHHRTT